MFLGCDRGESHTPNTKTQLAPNGAIIHNCSVKLVNNRSVSMTVNPPMKPTKLANGPIFNGILFVVFNFSINFITNLLTYIL